MEVSFIKLLNKSKFLYILRLYHFINREIFLQILMIYFEY